MKSNIVDSVDNYDHNVVIVASNDNDDSDDIMSINRISCCSIDLFYKESSVPQEDGTPWFETIGNITLSRDVMSLVIDRMGQLVLGVKTLFDTKCDSKNNTVSDKQIPGQIDIDR